MKVAVGLRRVAAGKRTSGRRAAQIALYETEKYLKYSGDYFEDTLTKFESYAGDLFPEVGFYEYTKNKFYISLGRLL